MKQWLLFLLAVILVVSMVACKSPDTSDNGEETPPVSDGDSAGQDPDTGTEDPDTTPDTGDTTPDTGDTTPDTGDTTPDDPDTTPDDKDDTTEPEKPSVGENDMPFVPA